MELDITEAQKAAGDALAKAVQGAIDAGLFKFAQLSTNLGSVRGKRQSYSVIVFANAEGVAEEILARTQAPTRQEELGIPAFPPLNPNSILESNPEWRRS